MPDVPHALLSQVEEVLVADIPTAVRAAVVGEPVYCLRIWFEGCNNDADAVPQLMLVKEATRRRHLAENGADAPYYVWGADENTNPDDMIPVRLDSPRLRELYREWHDYLDMDNEEETLRPFREIVRAASRRLNRLDWAPLAPVTDDFVVFPADSAHVFMDDQGDLLASATPEQLARLRSRGLLPAGAE